jgi:hypothetical protein
MCARGCIREHQQGRDSCKSRGVSPARLARDLFFHRVRSARSLRQGRRAKIQDESPDIRLHALPVGRELAVVSVTPVAPVQHIIHPRRRRSCSSKPQQAHSRKDDLKKESLTACFECAFEVFLGHRASSCFDFCSLPSGPLALSTPNRSSVCRSTGRHNCLLRGELLPVRSARELKLDMLTTPYQLVVWRYSRHADNSQEVEQGRCLRPCLRRHYLCTSSRH